MVGSSPASVKLYCFLCYFIIQYAMAEKGEDKTPGETPLQEVREAAETEEKLRKFLIFTVGDERFALPSGIIGEVAVLEKVFPLPLIPDYVRGIINRYSIPYTLIDISLFLKKDPSDAGKVIVLKEEIEKIAFLINDVVDIAELPSSQLIKIEKETDGFDTSINACFECKDKNVLCLDTDELIGRIRKDFDRDAWK